MHAEAAACTNTHCAPNRQEWLVSHMYWMSSQQGHVTITDVQSSIDVINRKPKLGVSAGTVLLAQVPPKQLPEGHVVPSFLLVAPEHRPVAGLHVPGLRQGPACAVQLTLLEMHKSAGCRTRPTKVRASVCLALLPAVACYAAARMHSATWY
jgi:hypothetical protein